MSSTEALAQLVRQRLGLRPSDHAPRAELATLVEARRLALGLENADAYVRRVMLAPEPELGYLAAAFTNGWTWFFRDHEAIEGLVARLVALRLGRPAHVWVAGCSSGEEAYGVAIASLEAGLDARVLATDVDATRLEHAARATYEPIALRRVPAPVVARHFEPLARGCVRVAAPVRERVELRLHNLLDPAPPGPGAGGWDAIVCRNVLLHCSADACETIARSVERALATHGVLLLGPGDPQPRGASLRSRPAAPAGTSPPVPSILPAPITVRPPRPPSLPVAAPLPAPSSRDDWSRAVTAIREGDHERARSALGSWLASHPDDVDARLTLGNLWLGAHELERAAEAYERAAALEPHCAELHFLWGALHRKRGAWSDAAGALRRALFHAPELWPARFLLAGTLERLGEPERARSAWIETLRSLARAPRIRWRSQVDEIESLACPPERARALCEQRARREARTHGG